MASLIAVLSLLTLSVLNTLGNYWLTYGIWPRSWFWLAFFAITNSIIYGMLTAVTKEINR